VAAVAAARLGTVTEASVSIDCTEPATTNGPAVFFQKCTTLPIHFVHHFFSSGLSINTCSHSLQFPPSLAVEASVMQHLQYGKKIPLKISKLATACPLPLLRGKTRHIIFPAPSLGPALPSSSLATAHDSDSAL